MSHKLYKYLTNEEKDLLYKRIEWLHLFCYNGWKWIIDYQEKCEGYINYQMTLLAGQYDCTITAFVSEHFEGIDASGDIGVSWLESSYEYERGTYAYNDLEDMLIGLEHAEKNLVTLGIPFTRDYKFHQKNKRDNYLLTKQNEKNRKKLECDKIANLWNVASKRITNDK